MRYSHALRRNLLILVILIAVLLSAACQSVAAGAVSSQPTASAAAVPSAASSFPVELTDASGATVTLQAPPQAIVATTVWAGEMLLDLVDVSRIRALSAWGDDPVLSPTADRAAAVKERVDISRPEAIVALNPDLVILDTFSNPDGSLGKTLREAGIPVLQMTSPTDFTMIAEAIRTLARATGETDRGEELVTTMNQTLQSVAEQVARVPEEDRLTVMFYEDYYDPSGNSANMLAAYGKGSPFAAIAAACGLRNVCDVQNYSPVAKEKVVGDWKPDLLVIPSSTFDDNFKAVDDGGARLRAAIEQDPLLATLPAVRNGRIIAIPDCYRGSTSHYMAQAVLELARAAYPDYVH